MRATLKELPLQNTKYKTVGELVKKDQLQEMKTFWNIYLLAPTTSICFFSRRKEDVFGYAYLRFQKDLKLQKDALSRT